MASYQSCKDVLEMFGLGCGGPRWLQQLQRLCVWRSNWERCDRFAAGRGVRRWTSTEAKGWQYVGNIWKTRHCFAMDSLHVIYNYIILEISNICLKYVI